MGFCTVRVAVSAGIGKIGDAMKCTRCKRPVHFQYDLFQPSLKLYKCDHCGFTIVRKERKSKKDKK